MKRKTWSFLGILAVILVLLLGAGSALEQGTMAELHQIQAQVWQAVGRVLPPAFPVLPVSVALLGALGYDPRTDVRHDANGCLEWAAAKETLVDAVREYFEARREDGYRNRSASSRGRYPIPAGSLQMRHVFDETP